MLPRAPIYRHQQALRRTVMPIRYLFALVQLIERKRRARANRPSPTAPFAYARQAELRMMLQKFARLNLGSSNASTSSFIVPQVVSGFWWNPL